MLLRIIVFLLIVFLFGKSNALPIDNDELLSVIVALRVHCSAQCKALLDVADGYVLEERGLVYMKVGTTFFRPSIRMYFIVFPGDFA